MWRGLLVPIQLMELTGLLQSMMMDERSCCGEYGMCALWGRLKYVSGFHSWMHCRRKLIFLGGFRIVLRDHIGDFVAAVVGPLGWTGLAFHAELCAA